MDFNFSNYEISYYDVDVVEKCEEEENGRKITKMIRKCRMSAYSILFNKKCAN